MSKRLPGLLLFASLLLGCRKSMVNAGDYFDGPAYELAVAIQRNDLDKARRLVGQVDLNGVYRENMTFLLGRPSSAA